MKIKTKVYKEVSSDMNVSDSEADSTDAELEDNILNQYRTNTIKHKYKCQAKTKHNSEMKQHLIQQKGFTQKLFKGTPIGLENLMVDLETTASTRGWNKLFMIQMRINPGPLDTLNLFTHKGIAEPREVTC